MTSGRIVTLTMNPAVDLCTTVERLVPGHKLRCGTGHHDAGGGGINVARVVKRLGGDPVAVFPAGGPMGELLKRLVAAEGLRFAAISVAGDTREDITVDESSTGAQYRFVLPGPTLSAEECEACVRTAGQALSPGGYLIASGSLPPGVSVSFYTGIAKLAATNGTKLILDSSGAGLKAALGSGLYLIKPSLREFEALIGATLPDNAARVAAARKILIAGACDWVALTMGEMGALLISRTESFFAAGLKVAQVSTVGAGDSFLGALVWSLAANCEPDEALRIGIAAGSAALLARGTGLCHAADIERLKAQVSVTRI